MVVLTYHVRYLICTRMEVLKGWVKIQAEVLKPNKQTNKKIKATKFNPGLVIILGELAQ